MTLDQVIAYLQTLDPQLNLGGIIRLLQAKRST